MLLLVRTAWCSSANAAASTALNIPGRPPAAAAASRARTAAITPLTKDAIAKKHEKSNIRCLFPNLLLPF
jgi:hypothetical protein